MSKEHYLVMRTTHEVNKPLFVTTNQKLAFVYCHKADETFKRLRARYIEVYNELDDVEDSVMQKILMRQYCKLSRLDIDILTPTTHYIEHIEIR